MTYGPFLREGFVMYSVLHSYTQINVTKTRFNFHLSVRSARKHMGVAGLVAAMKTLTRSLFAVNYYYVP